MTPSPTPLFSFLFVQMTKFSWVEPLDQLDCRRKIRDDSAEIPFLSLLHGQGCPVFDRYPRYADQLLRVTTYFMLASTVRIQLHLTITVLTALLTFFYCVSFVILWLIIYWHFVFVLPSKHIYWSTGLFNLFSEWCIADFAVCLSARL